ncbi:MAG TPA: acyl-CoA dehydrogenase family protein [Actinomycetota bacterium]|nr:acyl-CoA dehydrogenase family protein [Actinomycetota bacterium]
MDFDLSPADEAFREEFRAWLAEHAPPSIDVASDFNEAETLRAWQRTLARGRWVGIHWPVEYGGRGASLVQVAIYNEELARAHAPQILGRAGVNLVGPTLMAYGTEQQKAQWLPKILSAEHIWCQLFSEPGAGSDLAGLSTKAARRDGVYVVSGQKVWSSYAKFADLGIALVRTDPDAPKHKGISMLAVPMDAPGIEVRPLRQITGESEFNEVFFDDVPVPVENLIGVENDGWHVAGTTLANERGTSFVWKEQVLHEVARDLLLRRAVADGSYEDPLVRQKIAQSWIDVEIFRLHNARTLTRLEKGEQIGPESSIVKLFWSEMSQRLADAAGSILGLDGLVMPGDDGAVDGGRWARAQLWSRAASIAGGTSEIQRNIIAERILGLPREK